MFANVLRLRFFVSALSLCAITALVACGGYQLPSKNPAKTSATKSQMQRLEVMRRKAATDYLQSIVADRSRCLFVVSKYNRTIGGPLGPASVWGRDATPEENVLFGWHAYTAAADDIALSDALERVCENERAEIRKFRKSSIYLRDHNKKFAEDWAALIVEWDEKGYNRSARDRSSITFAQALSAAASGLTYGIAVGTAAASGSAVQRPQSGRNVSDTLPACRSGEVTCVQGSVNYRQCLRLPVC